MLRGEGHDWMTIIIAEIGSVHDGSFGNALRLIEAAANCGADAVKFQTHIPEAETVRDAPSPAYFSAEPRFEYFRRTGFLTSQWKQLAAHCRSVGATFLSSPFSLEAVDLLEAVGVCAYKVPSGEVSNLPLLERIAATAKPVYLSSGMSDWAELDAAVAILRPGGPVTVLQCTSAYPCPDERVGLNVLSEMSRRWGLPVGFSDHTRGIAAGVAAVALGATVIEKHFTFSRLMYGSDAENATEPDDFRLFCESVKAVVRMRAHHINKDDLTPYKEMKHVFEKSIVTAGPIARGTVLIREDLAFKKPGDGMPAAKWRAVIGRRVARDLAADHMLAEADLE
jgi:N-acetylneuraminate synthase